MMFPRRRRHPLLALAATMFLGGQTLWRFAFWIINTQRRTDVDRCPRGHIVPLVATWGCVVCRSFSESHAWSKCCVCGTRASWVSCPACNLPIRRGGRL